MSINKRLDNLETAAKPKGGFMAVYELAGKPGYFWDKKTDKVYNQDALDKLEGVTIFKVVRKTEIQGGSNRRLKGKS